jgi:hypothetical protein
MRYLSVVLAPTAVPPDTAKIHWVGGVNGVAFDCQRAYPRRSSKCLIAGINAAPRAFLITDAATNGTIPTGRAIELLDKDVS